MNQFLEFAKRHFAEKLCVSAEKVEKLYNFVQEHFYLSINSTPSFLTEQPQKFYSRLWFQDDDNAYIIAEFDKKAPLSTPVEALEKALIQVNRTTFSYFKYFPTNILILFDTERERKKIMAESRYFK